MNTPSTLNMSIHMRSNSKTHRPVALGKIFALFGARSKTENSIRSNEASSKAAPSYRLGEDVHHSGFGNGRVMAHWPDGTLLVRFDNAAKNRLVWPSLLDRVNGQRR